MAPFLVSTGVVALAEIGDKTQLLAFVLAARFRSPAPILLGILAATVANHAIAGAVGAWLTAAVPAETMQWILGLSFIGMAFWCLVPDACGDEATAPARYGVFVTTLIAFFVAEIGDKTQIATVAMAAQYQAFASVVAGTTLGMMTANAPVVMLADRIATGVSVRVVHGAAAAVFLAMGVWVLAGAAS